MLLYCLNCKKNTEKINPRAEKTKTGKPMLLSKCAVCDSKKSRFIEGQEASQLLLGSDSPLKHIILLGTIF